MAGIAITSAVEVNQLTGGLVLNFLQLCKNVHQVQASLVVTELMSAPFSMSQADNDQIKKAFELLDNAITNLEKQTDFATLQQLTQFRTF